MSTPAHTAEEEKSRGKIIGEEKKRKERNKKIFEETGQKEGKGRIGFKLYSDSEHVLSMTITDLCNNLYTFTFD